jgi:prephenate dehydratase
MNATRTPTVTSVQVAFQGIQGCYSELGLRQYFDPSVTAVGYESFEEVFEAVLDKRVTHGFIPVENSIAGTVVENYDLLLAHPTAIIAEVYMPIRHTLLAHPSVALQQIREAYSHPHALKQCRQFLKQHGIRAVPAYDTAGAAQMVAEGRGRQRAAIASELCAQYYGLEILARDIQTNRSNTTRFFVIVREDQRPADVEGQKTTLAFKTRHYPGALVDCLKIFQRHRLNLAKLQSRPIPENPFEYVFYAAIEAGLQVPAAQRALAELSATANFVKVLGSYPMADRCW